MHPQASIHAQSLADPSAFWLSAARELEWSVPPTVAYGPSKSAQGKDQWFPDTELSIVHNALDRHCRTEAGRKRPAIHHVSPFTKTQRTLSYGEILEEVKVLAGVLREKGVKRGDRVVIYMPMIPEAAFAMLAVSRIGASHSVVFGGFAAKELAKRIESARPSLILAASFGIEPKGLIDYTPLLEEALRLSPHKPSGGVVLFRRRDAPPEAKHELPALREGWACWRGAVAKVREEGRQVEKCVNVRGDEMAYMLYTSGSTGMPKGVTRHTAGHAVTSRYLLQHIFGMNQDSTIFCASDLGWVVGHVFILYAPLLLGCASVLFEGKPILPDAGIFWKIVQDYKVNHMYLAPTGLRAIQREDPEAKLMRQYDIRSLRGMWLAGERSEPGIVSRYQRLLNELSGPRALVVDNYWSTESGSPITGLSLSTAYAPLPPRPGAAGIPLPGMDVRVVDDAGKEVPRGQLGNLVLAQPLHPTFLPGLWENEEGFEKSYFKRFRGKGGWFDTSDAGMIDQDGYVHVLSRSDDVINVAGHRLSTSLIEQVIVGHSSVAEACVVGLPDKIKGHVPFALVSLASGQSATQDMSAVLKDVNAHVRSEIGSIASLAAILAAPSGRLPKTRSGKTLRRTVRALVENGAEGKWDGEVPVPPTIEDRGVVEEAKKAVYEWFRKGSAKL